MPPFLTSQWRIEQAERLVVLIKIGGLSGSSRKTLRSCMAVSLFYLWDKLTHFCRLISHSTPR